MSLTSANVSYPPHLPMPQHRQQLSYPHSYPHHPDISPTMSHDSISSNSSGPVSPPTESSHPLYISTTTHHHSHPHQQQQHLSSYHHDPYQAPSPPYSYPHRSGSTELAQKPTLPYPRPSHTYSTSSHRAHPYSPSTLPPLTGRVPLSPQSPVDSTAPYPMPNANRDERHRYRTASPMSASPPPSSSPTSSVLSSAAPLSANDRRERNKAASAKYRAKKHYQSGEMRSQITVLQDQNNVITRQLEECRAENASLKNMVEKLKGRLVAEKVLKRLREVGREKKRRGSGAGHAAKVSAQDLAVSDSEVDDDDDDVVDAVEKAVEDDDEEGIEENDAVLAGIEKRSSERKAHSRRRAVRTNDDDEDYRED